MNFIIGRNFNRILNVRTLPPIYRSCHNQEENGFKKIKRFKRLFSTLLFGSTLATALYLKRRRQNQLNETFQDCELLKLDEHYAKPNMFYRFKQFVLPDFVVKEIKEIETFHVNEDDIYVVSFPKTGTTWVQEIVYLIASALDFETAEKIGIETRFPYLEFIYPGLKHVEKLEAPRFVKSHLPLSLLPKEIETKKPKIIYVMRNPKDTLVSFYYFVKSLTATSYSGTFEDFFNSFLQNKIPYGPLDEHFTQFWNKRDMENVLIVMYEDLHKDLPGSILKIANFLGRDLTQEDVKKIESHCQFTKMAENKSVNYAYWEDLGIRKKNAEPFMRKGVVGDWENYFNVEMNLKINQWIEEKLTPSGLTFIYSIKTSMED